MNDLILMLICIPFFAINVFGILFFVILIVKGLIK